MSRRGRAWAGLVCVAGLIIGLSSALAAPDEAWLTSAQARIDRRWKGSFLADCERYLPPDHALNDKSLLVWIELTISAVGDVESAVVATPSKAVDFDRSALEVAQASGPLPKPGAAELSDDGKVHLRLPFARAPAAMKATAKVQHIRWSADRAVPMLIAGHRFADAAQRLTQEGGPKAMALGRQLAEAVIGEALETGRADAVELAGLSGRASLVPALRRAAETKDSGRLAEALRALGRAGDPAVEKLLLTALDPARPRVALAAAGALGALSLGAEGWPKVASLLANRATRRQGLSLAAALGQGVDIDALSAALKTGTEVEKGLAATALGAAAGGAVGSATHALRKALTAKSGRTRAAAAIALGRVGRDGARSKGLFYRVIPLHTDSFSPARAGAVVAMAALGRVRANDDVGIICRRARTDSMRLACAQALALIDTEPAARSLLKLASRSDVLKRTALEALAARETPAADRLVQQLADDAAELSLESQVRVRAALIRAQSGGQSSVLLEGLHAALTGAADARVLHCAAWLRASR